VSDVIDIREHAADARTATLRPKRPPSRCAHLRVEVWEDRPCVECAGCGAVLDAHQVLLGYARQERAFQWRTEAGARHLRELQLRVHALQREERLLKARLRRARRAAPADAGPTEFCGRCGEVPDECICCMECREAPDACRCKEGA
jgi:hypothetical protein